MQHPTPPADMMTVRAVAERLRIDRRGLRAAVLHGRIPGKLYYRPPLGYVWYLRLSDAEEYVRSRPGTRGRMFITREEKTA